MAAASGTTSQREARNKVMMSNGNKQPIEETTVQTDEQELQSFIAENIRSHRTCSNHSSSRVHLNPDIDSGLKSSGWSSDARCADLMIGTDAFGQIYFRSYEGAHRQSLPPYIKLSSKTKHEALWNLLSTFWKLPVPPFIVSLIGATEPAPEVTGIVRRCTRELIRICALTGAWINTNGKTTGVARLAGCEMAAARRNYESRKLRRLVLLGVSPWSSVRNRHSLVNEECNGLHPAFYDDGSSTRGIDTNEGENQTLDANHTHIILFDDAPVDDSVSDAPGTQEVRFQAYLQSVVAHSGEDDDVAAIPTVHVLFGGHCKDLTYAHHAIGVGMPLVVFEKTGGAAELVAKAFEIAKGLDRDDRAAVRSFSKRISSVMRRTLGRVNRKCKTYLMDMLNKKHLVTIIWDYRCSGDMGADYAILSAIKHCSKVADDKILKLATKMNRHNFVERELFASHLEWNEAVCIQDVLLDCLVSNKHQMVQVLLNRGTEVVAFVTKKNMELLYTKTLAAKGNNTQRLLLQSLLTSAQPQRRSKSCLLSKIGKLVSRIIGGNDCLFQDGEILLAEGADSLSAKHLLVWATLFARSELAEYFWKTGADHLGTSVMAYCIASKLSEKASNEHMSVLSSQYQSLATYFERIGCEVLQACYDSDADATLECITRRIDFLGGETVMSMADHVHHSLIGHASCQKYLGSIWMGKMADDTSSWKLIISLCFPLAFVPSLQFKMAQHVSTASNTPQDTSMRKGCCDFRTNVKVVERFSKGSSIFPQETTQEKHRGENQFEKSAHRRRVTMCSSTAEHVNYFTALGFFFCAPVTKYAYSTVSHVAFVITFAIFLLTELAPISDASGIQALEILTWIWCLSFILEEMRQVMDTKGTSLRQKFARWWSDLWNKVDIAQNLLFIVGVILRFRLSKDSFLYARLAYTMSLTMFFLRSIQLLFVFKTIGLKMILMGRMFWDLVFFTFVLSVFLVCFGVAYSSLLYPQGQLDADLLSKVVYDPYRVALGQLPFDDLTTLNHSVCSAPTSPANETQLENCPISGDEAGRNLALYYLVANVLVINLLMALFRAQSIQQHPPERMWQYSRYSLVYEIFQRPALPCPLSLLSPIHVAASKIKQATAGDGKVKKINDFVTHLNDDEARQVREFEADATKRIFSRNGEHRIWPRISKQPRAERSCSDEASTSNAQLKAINETLSERLQTMQRQYSELQSRVDYMIEHLQSAGGQQCGCHCGTSNRQSSRNSHAGGDNICGGSACESDASGSSSRKSTG